MKPVVPFIKALLFKVIFHLLEVLRIEVFFLEIILFEVFLFTYSHFFEALLLNIFLFWCVFIRVSLIRRYHRFGNFMAKDR
jgi:hypothetical protein